MWFIGWMMTRGRNDKESLPAPAAGTLADVSGAFNAGPVRTDGRHSGAAGYGSPPHGGYQSDSRACACHQGRDEAADAAPPRDCWGSTIGSSAERGAAAPTSVPRNCTPSHASPRIPSAMTSSSADAEALVAPDELKRSACRERRIGSA